MTESNQLKNFLKKGNIILVILALFFVIVIPIVGFKTINTLLFELVPNTDKVRYSYCIEEEYDERGTHCIVRDFKFTSIETRIKSHFTGSLFIWFISIIIIFFYNLEPKIRKKIHPNRLNSEELKQIEIEKESQWHGNKIDYKISIKNNSKATLNKISLIVLTGIYIEYDLFNHKTNFTKNYPLILNVKIPPNTKYNQSGSIDVKEIVLTKRQKQEGWRSGIHRIGVSYIESFKETICSDKKN